jgi:kynurenine 3-monooxygenase
MQHITIIGAGLCGSLLGLRLAQRGYKVTLFEKRNDNREESQERSRSINLALSDRGIGALKMVGLAEMAQKISIPMHGRAIHALGEIMPSTVNYSGRDGEFINSVSRKQLNILIIEELRMMPNVEVYFGMECDTIDEKTKLSTFRKTKSTDEKMVQSFDILIGTDGANSAIRNRFNELSSKIRFDFEIKYLDTGYKELEIPAGSNGAYQLSKNHLHIWPRKGFMMIALPNLDGSFTVTLFLPFEGEVSFDTLKTDSEITNFFETHFATAAALMPDLLSDFRANPSSSLSTVKCAPWTIDNRIMLMGDAAHAIVPFYGQGMNASFEDVVVLDGLIEKYGDNWDKIMVDYTATRKVDTDAIADLASDNFYEMRDATADPVFMKKRKIELMLEQTYPDYFSKYSMVTFREDMKYSEAMSRGRTQDAKLMEIAAKVDDVSQVDLVQIRELLII